CPVRRRGRRQIAGLQRWPGPRWQSWRGDLPEPARHRGPAPAEPRARFGGPASLLAPLLLLALLLSPDLLLVGRGPLVTRWVANYDRSHRIGLVAGLALPSLARGGGVGVGVVVQVVG